MMGQSKKLLTLYLLATLITGSLCITNDNDEKPINESDYRLPKLILPTSYSLKYTDINFNDFTFKGDVMINLNVLEETKEIVLHSGNLTTNVLSILHMQTNIKLDPMETHSDNETDKFTILLSESLKPMDNIKLVLSFNGTLRNDMIGFYRSSYIDAYGVQKWLAATQFETTYARHAFPCFDEPAMKATFNISILLPEDYHCLSNMRLSRKQGKWCIFEPSKTMSTYLVAFIISDFPSLSKNTDNFTLEVYSRKNAIYQAHYARDIGVSALYYFAKLLDEPYQLKKMDMVAVPDFSTGAMENWGLVTYRENSMLYNESESSAEAQQRVASVIVHECTHMWFGNLVTPDWWSYLWLSEAFARYYEYIATDKIETSWKMDQQFVVEQLQASLGVDGLENSVPMTRAAVTQSQIGKMGDFITYGKGASVIRMMELTFGFGIFNSALRDYLKDRQYKNAKPDDLWRALQKHVDAAKDPMLNISVATVMKTWTEQPGFPCISVSIKPDYIQLSQQRFLLQNPNTIPTDSLWWVPITWTSSSQFDQKSSQSTKPVFWLSTRNAKLPNENKSADWMILNVQSAGFYRVKYDTESWNRIFKVLMSENFEQIHELNRAAIVDDLLNLARAEMLSYEIALQGIQYLKRETNYLPFKSAFGALDYLIKKFNDYPDRETFRNHLMSLVTNIYDKLTYDDKPGDDRLTILLRNKINNILCSIEHQQCIAKSRKYFADWRTKLIPIPKNQRSVAYCTAIKHGDDEDWEFLWENYRNANLNSEQITILNALGCTGNTEILKKYLLTALTSFEENLIRKQDISTVFSSVYSASADGTEFVLDFIETEHEAIFKYFNGYDEASGFISAALKKYTTVTITQKLEDIIKRNPPHLQSIIPSLKKSLTQAKFELQWFEKNSPTIINWILNNKIAEKPSEENTLAYRLPKNVIPSAYNIHLSPINISNNFIFEGTVKINAKVVNATDKIVLHIDLLQIEESNVKIYRVDENNGLGELGIKSILETEKYHFMNIIMETPIESNTLIRIEISYTGLFNQELKGFYRGYYVINNETRWLAATHLEPVGARRVFPCFDEPALKATFNISVDVPENYTAISNMKVNSKINGVWQFDTTPLMSTYLVAVVVSDYAVKSEEIGERTYGAWANPLVSHQLNYSLSVVGPIVKLFESRFGLPYPLPKLDMVALQQFSSGAMENWGLMTFRETNMLYDPRTMSTLGDKQIIRNVIAHEIAHQWFGDLVSPLWWDYLWLNEGFARYFQYFAHTEEEDGWNLEAQFVVDHLQTSFSFDASTGTHPVTHKVYSPTDIRGIFDKISYAKAASLIRMLEKLVGSEIFYSALQDYLDKYKYSTGTPELLFTAFQNQISKKPNEFNVTKFMNSWTRQPGFPVLNVVFNGNKATLSQSRFYTRPQNATDKSGWIIPITYATRTNPNFNETQKVTWIRKKSQIIEINNASTDWVILNVQQIGYYRVNYDRLMWSRIIKALNSEERLLIPEINRASLIDDMMNLERAGLLDSELVLNGTRYLSQETEYVPWKAASHGFEYFYRRFDERPEIFGSYKAYIVGLLEPNFKILGFEETPGEKHTHTLLRKLVLDWLCRLEHEECVKEAVRLFAKERNSVTNYRVPPNQQSFVYCTGVRHGTTDDYNYIEKRFEESIYATERMSLLFAFGCTKNRTLLERLLDNAIQPESNIKFQDVKKVFTSVIKTVVGVETALDFIVTNHLKMQENLKDDSIAKSTLSTLSKRLSTVKLVQKFEGFVKSGAIKIPSISKSLQSYLKRANFELNWYNEHAPKILEWLERNNPQSNYRLADYAKPKAYDIHLVPYFEERNFTFDGKVYIDVKIEVDTFQIELHADGLEFKKISLADNSEEISTAYNATTHKLTLFFKNLVTAGTELKLFFDYSGTLKNDMRGFYRSYYIDELGNKRWIASTQFQPTYARRAFPCFDEPSFKATFQIHVAKPSGYHTLSNMGSDPKKRWESTVNRTWDDYEVSIKMASYVVAFVVSDFISVKANSSNSKLQIAVWGRSDLKNYLTYAPVVGGKALSSLGNLTQIEYPLKEMNLVAIPDIDLGAMENWGLVTFREIGLTYSVFSIAARYKRYVNTVISHELVHMWFGNLVTCEWWEYIWLNEGFAQYLSQVISNTIEPSWQLPKQFVVNELQAAMGVDSSATSHPMNNKVLTPTEVQDGFDEIAYKKSASVLRMFHHSFGQKVFIEALHNYLKSHEYSNVRPEYLYEAIQNRLNNETKSPGDLEEDVATVMSSWTTQAGYPVVNASRDGNTVNLSQERFLMSSTNSSEKQRTYWVPITYTTETEQDFENTSPRFWLGSESKRINLQANDTWFIVNVQEIGFYRVNYDKATWQQLVRLLNSEEYETIGEVNRAQIIDDSLNLARAGYLDYHIALNATKYLIRESSYLPWQAHVSAMDYVGLRLKAQRDIRRLFAHHILTLLNATYAKLGFKEDMIKDSHLDQLTREMVLTYACKYGHEDCLNQSKAYFGLKSVTPNIAFPVYCTAIEHGTSDDWDVLWNKYPKAILATDYVTIIKGLGCSRNVTILERYLDLIISSESLIRRQDVNAAISSIYTSSQIGLRTTVNYFKNNLAKLYNYFGDWHKVGSLISSMAGSITTKDELQNFEELSNAAESSNIQSDLKSAVKTANRNLDWFDKNSAKIHAWLKNNYGDLVEPEESEPSGSGSPILSYILSLILVLLMSISIYCMCC